jgi:intracellular sulfur oxidation DsrE/DsrF family protein
VLANTGKSLLLHIVALALVLTSFWATAGDAPWGRAQLEERDFAPQKVVYDVSVSDVETFEGVLDRVSYLNLLYHADPFASSLVMVLHGDEIGFFAIENYAKYKDLMARAQSLTLSGPIEFRVCKLAAKSHGYEPADLQGFVQVVPMADAEIIRLQREEGYAYMQ